MANKATTAPAINLQDFITEALVQIIEGVKEAQEKVQGTGAMINPSALYKSPDGPQWAESRFDSDTHYGQTIEFDVAVTAGDKGDIKGGIGVVGSVINLGYTAGKGSETSSVSRIKFSVPVFLPQQIVETKTRDYNPNTGLTQKSRWETG